MSADTKHTITATIWIENAMICRVNIDKKKNIIIIIQLIVAITNDIIANL